VRAAKTMGLNVCGVDMLRANHGPVVMEVNSSPGLEGVEKATGIDIAGKIIEHLESNAKPGKTRTTGQGLMPRSAFEIGGMRVAPGSRQTVDLPVSVLSDHTPVSMSVHVVHGRAARPDPFVSAAIHGDEVIGVEIVRRRLLRAPQLGDPRHAAGRADRQRLRLSQPFALSARPARSQPVVSGARTRIAGRPAGRICSCARSCCARDFGIDLHSAADPPHQPAADPGIAGRGQALDLAEAFGAPVVILAKLRDGSLRKAAQERGVDILLFEAGEGLRFDELSARAGLAGILRVMNAMGMIPRKGVARAREKPLRAMSSVWLRAPAGGLMRGFKGTGEYVEEGDLLGQISDPFGETEIDVVSETTGVIVGRTNLPIVNEGDALFHIAETRRSDAEDKIDALARQLQGDPMFDEDEIIDRFCPAPVLCSTRTPPILII
jgi:predicted deacylase